MFGLSFWEIAVILVVALLALGPEKLPKLLKTIGRGMRQVRQASNELRSAIEEPLEELKAPLQEMRDGLYEGVSHAQREIEDEARRIEAEGHSLMGLTAADADLDEVAEFVCEQERAALGDGDDADEAARIAALDGETEHALARGGGGHERYLAEHADGAGSSAGGDLDAEDAPTRHEAVPDDLFDDGDGGAHASDAPTEQDASIAAKAAADAGDPEEARTELNAATKV